MKSFPSTRFIMNGFLRKTILNLVETNAEYNNKSSCDTPWKAFPIQIGRFENLGMPGVGWWGCLNPVLMKKTSSIFAGPRVGKCPPNVPLTDNNDLYLYLKCHSSTGVFHAFCKKKPTTWFQHKWNIGLKWVTGLMRQNKYSVGLTIRGLGRSAGAQ